MKHTKTETHTFKGTLKDLVRGLFYDRGSPSPELVKYVKIDGKAIRISQEIGIEWTTPEKEVK